MRMSAMLSTDGLYRYELRREWDCRLPPFVVIMLNPSKADAKTNDPTITRLITRARRLGYGSLIVGNIGAGRSTQPKRWLAMDDPIGPANKRYLKSMLQEAKDRRGMVLLGWGMYIQRWQMIARIPIRKAALRVRIVEGRRVEDWPSKPFKRILPAPLDPTSLEPDYVARKIIIHAFLYYVLDAPVIPDDEYDRYSQYVAKHWEELDPDRQWALGSADQILSTGYHVKFSSMAVGAALNYVKYNSGEMYKNYPEHVWRHRRNGTSYVTVSVQKPERIRIK